MKALTIEFAAASMTKTGLPAAPGATPRTAATKRSRVVLSLPSPLGATSTRFSPSAETQRCVNDWGNFDRHVLGHEQTSDLTQGRHQRCDGATLSVVSGRLGLLCQCCQDACETACLNGGRAGVGLAAAPRRSSPLCRLLPAVGRRCSVRPDQDPRGVVKEKLALS